MCYQTVDDAIKMTKLAGNNCWIFKADITAAFKVIPINPDFWQSFSVQWQGKCYVAVRLTFGCRSSPKIVDTLSEALCWILLNNYKVPFLVHLLDDFLTITPHTDSPAAGHDSVLRVFESLGMRKQAVRLKRWNL